MPDPNWPLGRYKLTERAHIPPMPGKPHALLERDDEVVWGGRPGAHMQPLDDQAKANVARVEAEELQRAYGGRRHIARRV